jgi:tRNA1Val (adenine37-N6)-methyltransferase
MGNNYFQFRQFIIHQDRTAMKVTTDACLFGAWVADKVRKLSPRPITALDIGAGSGLLSLMVAQQNGLLIDAIELDAASAKQAKENINVSPWRENIKIFQGDVRSHFFAKKYDCIFSNPPFYENELKSPGVKKNVAHHDLGLKLWELVAFTRRNLSPEGHFYFLLPYKRFREIREMMATAFLLTEIVLLKPSARHDYSRILLGGQHKPEVFTETNIDECCIKDEQGRYSAEFTQLLRDYYLYL